MALARQSSAIKKCHFRKGYINKQYFKRLASNVEISDECESSNALIYILIKAETFFGSLKLLNVIKWTLFSPFMLSACQATLSRFLGETQQ